MKPDNAHDYQALRELADMRMPYGKYSGRLLIDLPEPYVIWLSRQGFPAGKLGNMLRALYEIKINGLEYLFTPLRNNNPGSSGQGTTWTFSDREKTPPH
jgi:uncharacterized protein